MKIKGKSEKPLFKAYDRLIKTNPVKAGYIKNYWNKHFSTGIDNDSSDGTYYKAVVKGL